MFIWYMIYDIHVYTGFVQLHQVTIEGLFKDNFLFFKDWGSRHIWLNTHLPLCKTQVTAQKKWQAPQKLRKARFENKAANTLAKLSIHSDAYFVFFTHTVVLINMKNTFLDCFKQFWVMYYLEIQGLFNIVRTRMHVHVDKPFACSHCVICISCSVHLISMYYPCKGSWAFLS